MQLPRYISQALPEEATVSPQQAGAGAAALSSALASGLDVVSKVTETINKAEAGAAADAALAETKYRVKQFVSDPRWTQPEIDGKPTADVLKTEWDALASELRGKDPVIRDREAKNQFALQRNALLVDAGIDVTSNRRKLTVERAKALTDYSADRRAQMGDYKGAMEAYDRGVQSGLYSVAEYLSRQQKLQVSEVEDGYLKLIQPGAPDVDLAKTGAEILIDSRLPAANRRSLFRTVVSETERRDRADGRETKAARQANAAAAWARVDDLGVGDIAGLNLTPEDKEQLIRYKRNQLIEGVDRPEAVSEISALFVDVATGKASKQDAQNAIASNQSSGRLSAQSAAKYQTSLATLSDQNWSDPTFTTLLNEGDRAINKGVPSEQLITAFRSRELDQRQALSVEWRQKFLDAKIRGGPSFDATAWYQDNLPKFQERSKSIAHDDTGNEYARFRINQADGKLDYNATKAAIDKALKDKQLTDQQHADAYYEFGMDR